MAEEFLDKWDSSEGEEDNNIESAVTRLRHQMACLIIEPQQDTLTTLGEAITEALASPKTDSEESDALERCRNLLCSILFQLEEFQLDSAADVPLDELPSHLMALSQGAQSETELNLTAIDTQMPHTENDLLKSPSAKLIWEIGNYFHHFNEPSAPISPEHRDRLTNLYICSATEIECSHRLQPALEKIWANREALIRPMLVISPGKVALAPEPAAILSKLEEKYSHELLGARLPGGALVAALRLILARQSKDYRPSLIESATFFLFLASSLEMEVEKLPVEQAQELGVRLLGLHKLKQTCLDFECGETIPAAEAGLSDAGRALELLDNTPRNS